jgi:hypothetical protein
VEELFFPEGQLFRLAFSSESVGYGIGYSRYWLAYGHFRMNGVWPGTTAEQGFILRALQADQGKIIPTELSVFHHLDDATFFAAPAHHGEPGLTVCFLDGQIASAASSSGCSFEYR